MKIACFSNEKSDTGQTVVYYKDQKILEAYADLLGVNNLLWIKEYEE